MSKVLTSFMETLTAEGERLIATYSEVEEDGSITSQANKVNYVVRSTETEILQHIQAVKDYLSAKLAE